jgi:two-component system sensor histidine kinase DesK
MTEPQVDEHADRAVRLATRVVLAYAVGTSFLLVFIFLTRDGLPSGYQVQDVAAAAAVLPLVIASVLAAARGVRTRASWWLLAGLAIVVLGMIPFGGVLWLAELQLLAGVVLLVVPPPWSVPLFAGLVVVSVVVANAEHIPQETSWLGMKTLQGGLSLAVLTWLVQVIRRAQAARQELAEEAVIAERLRIDAELTRTVCAALERIVAEAQQAAAELEDPRMTAVQLQALAAFSRHTLAHTRRILTSYQEVSAQAELQTAVTLLSVAGVRAALELPPEGMPEVLPAGLHEKLRSGIARMLADDAARDCVIAITAPGPVDQLDLLVSVCLAAETGAA